MSEQDKSFPEVLFLLTIAGHPRHWKRIEAARDTGMRVTTAGYTRLGQDKPDPAVTPDAIFGQIGSSYLRRLLGLVRALLCMVSLTRSTDVVYAFGSDMLALAVFTRTLSRRSYRIVFEIGDIRDLQLRSSALASAYRWAERRFLSRTDQLVVTSRAFAQEYVAGIQQAHILADGALTVPNKPALPQAARNEAVTVIQRARTGRQSLTVGWFGRLRCPLTQAALFDWASEHPDSKLILAGSFTETMKWDPEAAPRNVEFLGSYRNPDDLTDIYSRVDLVWAAYPLRFDVPGNWQWASTNRYYECCYFGVPPVTRAGTPDADDAARHGYGSVIAVRRTTWLRDVVEGLARIDSESVERWRRALLTVPSQWTTTHLEQQAVLHSVMSLAVPQIDKPGPA
jgi:succinoglycan biosynthesis protein ExoL